MVGPAKAWVVLVYVPSAVLRKEGTSSYLDINNVGCGRILGYKCKLLLDLYHDSQRMSGASNSERTVLFSWKKDAV